MQPVVVALAADSAYQIGLLVAVRSLLENFPADRPIEIYVLDGGLTRSARDHVGRTVDGAGRNSKVSFVTPSLGVLRDAPPNYRGSVMPYARLLLPEIIPRDRVIYIDSDMVIQKNLAEVWEIDMQGRAVAAVQDGLVQTFGGETPDATQDDRPYFNSGFLILDLNRWRTTDATAAVMRYLGSDVELLRYWDQSALNQAFVGAWKELDAAWNAFPKMIERSGGRLNPSRVNLHFVAGCKPWVYGHSHWNFMDRFYHYLDMTSRAGWRPQFAQHIVREVHRRVKRVLSRA